jgi:hypothetical protein
VPPSEHGVATPKTYVEGTNKQIKGDMSVENYCNYCSVQQKSDIR